MIVITRGERGAFAIHGEDVAECGIKENLKIVDLTGAGDLFASGFLHGHINNLSLRAFFPRTNPDLSESFSNSWLTNCEIRRVKPNSAKAARADRLIKVYQRPWSWGDNSKTINNAVSGPFAIKANLLANIQRTSDDKEK